MTGEKIAYIARGNQNKKKYHTDRDCPYFKSITNVREASVGEVQGREECKWCRGETIGAQGDGGSKALYRLLVERGKQQND